VLFRSQRLLIAAHRFKLAVLAFKCEEYLIQNITPPFAPELLNLALSSERPVLESYCMEYIASNLNEVMMKSGDEYASLTGDTCRALLLLAAKNSARQESTSLVVGEGNLGPVIEECDSPDVSIHDTLPGSPGDLSLTEVEKQWMHTSSDGAAIKDSSASLASVQHSNEPTLPSLEANKVSIQVVPDVSMKEEVPGSGQTPEKLPSDVEKGLIRGDQLSNAGSGQSAEKQLPDVIIIENKI